VDFSDISPPEQRIGLAEMMVAALAHVAADLAVTVAVIGHQLLCHLAADRAGTGVAGE
jgi:hypothetical protein